MRLTLSLMYLHTSVFNEVTLIKTHLVPRVQKALLWQIVILPTWTVWLYCRLSLSNYTITQMVFTTNNYLYLNAYAPK